MSRLTIAGRQAFAAGTDIACRVLGRRTVIRAARYVLLRARFDYPNHMALNGERALQGWSLAIAPAGEFHAADVGANVGLWSQSMQAAAAGAGRGADLRLHAFEPDARAFALLQRSLGMAPAALARTALSDRAGAATFHVVAPGAGTNSLHVGRNGPTATETIQTATLDAYAASSGVPGFGIVKVDTEGHDLAVLRGARGLLAEHRIAVVQFEYNHRWVFARTFLRDAIEYLTDLGYRVGKLTPRGVEFYPGWDPDLETFVEGNYVACSPMAARGMPVVRWWKTP